MQRIDSLSAFVNNVSTTLVSNIQYDANNLVTSRTYGNGLVDARNYDLQSRLLSQTLGGIESVGYSYDLNGNVTQRNPGSITHAYDYDVLDRLIEDTLGGASTDYGYDANHNRVLATQGGNSISYSMSNNSNQLESIDSTNLTYDANGNLTADGQGKTFAYNDANRLESITESNQVIASYTYNAAGQRKTKVTPTTTTVYHYDLGGNLISETTPAGSAIKDYIWQGNEPVVQIDVAGTETITYLHTDHLMTARLGTDSSGTITWRWESDAFGQTAPEEDVDNDSVNTVVNLRFPGQYYDQESGLHYNYFRFYDPAVGRYLRSDQIGLNGGLNTYIFADMNSLSYIDLFGLRKVKGRGGNPSMAGTGGVNMSVGTSATVGTTTVGANTSNPGPSWGQTTQAGVGASVDVCIYPPPKKDDESMQCKDDVAENRRGDGEPDNFSAGMGRNLGISIHKNGTICISFGPSLGLPVGVGWDL